MTLAVILAATLLFFIALQRSRLVDISWSVIAESNGALGALRDPALDDDARERAARQFAIRMFAMFGRIAALSILVCAAPFAILALAVAAGITDSDAIWRVSTSWAFIAANVALFVIMLKWDRKA